MYSHSKAMRGKGNPNYRHGFNGTPTFQSWVDMRQRCYNPHNKDYKDYGRRGIRVSPRWQFFENFLEDMGPRPKGKTLDRIKGNESYSKFNCRWATPLEQSQNRRRDYNKGEANSHAKLTKEDVQAIRSSDYCACKLAGDFGVHESTIYNIKSNRTWKEVKSCAA